MQLSLTSCLLFSGSVLIFFFLPHLRESEVRSEFSESMLKARDGKLVTVHHTLCLPLQVLTI